LTDQQSQWANATWQGLVESRRKRDRRRGVALGFLGLLILGLLAVLFVQRKAISALPVFTIRVIEVTGNRAITEAEVYDLLDLRAGDPWWSLKPDAVRARAAGHPQIAGIEMRYSWFHRLHVAIAEREPVLAVMGALDGEVTRDGWFLPAREGNIENDLPILRPAPGSMPVPGSPVGRETAALARLVGELHDKRPDLWRDLSEFELSAGQAYAYLRTRTAVIRFIPGMHDELWARVPTVLGDLDRRKRTDVVLDLRFDDRIVVHLPESAVPDTLEAKNGRGRT
jgi:hypothetical protein